MSLKISISGVRGVYPEQINEDVAYSLVCAYCELVPEGAIVVARDTRESGEVLKQTVIDALAVSRREIIDIDVAPLPTTAMAVTHFGAAGGIDITASHNPPEYNGLKFLNEKGQFISQSQADILSQAPIVPHKKQEVLNISDGREEAIKHHLDLCAEIAESGRKLIVAVDACNASGSEIVPRLLEKLGCEVVSIATQMGEPFPHLPEPKRENLEWTLEQLEGREFDFCAVVDPDADRLVLIDERGDLLSEELTISLVVKSFLRRQKSDAVINTSTTSLVERLAEEAGQKCFRSAVGEKNVVEKMLETGALVGGEGSGGVIDGRVHYGRDSLVGIVHIVNLLRAEEKPLSEIVATLPEFHMSKANIPLSTDLTPGKVQEKMQELFPDQVEVFDGLKAITADGWVQIRFSNTEPLMRVIAEAGSKEKADALVKQVQDVLSG